MARSRWTIGVACKASSSRCTPESAGITCRPSLVSDPASPAGGGFAAGARPESGIDFIDSCCPSYTHVARSTGRRSASTARMSGLRKGGAGTGPSPVDRGRPGSKHHIACDSAGIPIAVITAAGNVPDVKAAPNLVEAIPPVAGRLGHPRRRPERILADGGYDSRAFREWLRARQITSSSHGAAARRSY
jgi:hypothetical protein